MMGHPKSEIKFVNRSSILHNPTIMLFSFRFCNLLRHTDADPFTQIIIRSEAYPK